YESVAPRSTRFFPSCNPVASDTVKILPDSFFAVKHLAEEIVAAPLQPLATTGVVLMPLPQTEVPGRLQAHFAERGIRMTQQRRAILSVMETASKHLDASQILRKAQKIDASVDRSTVYRTLRLLKRHGLIDELDLMHINGEGHYYERRLGRDHIHM